MTPWTWIDRRWSARWVIRRRSGCSPFIDGRAVLTHPELVAEAAPRDRDGGHVGALVDALGANRRTTASGAASGGGATLSGR